MAITNPDHWKESYKAKGTKYNKILEIIAALNTLEGSEDHGNLAGLADDDHAQYVKADGTRPFSGAQSMGSHKLTNVTDPTAAQDSATKAYVDLLTNRGSANSFWQPCVIAPNVNVNSSSNGYVSYNTGTILLYFTVPLPPAKSGLSLYIRKIRVGLYAAGGSDYLSQIRLFGVDYSGGGTVLVTDDTDYNSPQLVEFDHADQDVSSYERAQIRLTLVIGTTSNLIISSVGALCDWT